MSKEDYNRLEKAEEYMEKLTFFVRNVLITDDLPTLG